MNTYITLAKRSLYEEINIKQNALALYNYFTECLIDFDNTVFTSFIGGD